MTAIYHTTSPGQAYAVVSHGRYTPISANPLNADSGLNCFSKAQQFWPNQELGAYGARIYFNWLGPIAALPVGTAPPLPTGILLDQAPWRLHLRGPIGSQQLRVTRMAFADDALVELLGQAVWERWVPKRWRPHRRRRLRFLSKLRECYRDTNCFVTIV